MGMKSPWLATIGLLGVASILSRISPIQSYVPPLVRMIIDALLILCAMFWLWKLETWKSEKERPIMYLLQGALVGGLLLYWYYEDSLLKNYLSVNLVLGLENAYLILLAMTSDGRRGKGTLRGMITGGLTTSLLAGLMALVVLQLTSSMVEKADFRSSLDHTRPIILPAVLFFGLLGSYTGGVFPYLRLLSEPESTRKKKKK